MPGFDGSGPEGRGPLTGRGQGYCTGDEFPGGRYGGRGRGWGFGDGQRFGRGRGRGYRWQHWARATGWPRWMRDVESAPWWGPPTADEEAGWLKTQITRLREELDALTQRLTELESEE